MTRRCDINQMTPTERIMHEVMVGIEHSGADVRLTQAQVHLQQAMDWLGDWVDGETWRMEKHEAETKAVLERKPGLADMTIEQLSKLIAFWHGQKLAHGGRTVAYLRDGGDRHGGDADRYANRYWREYEAAAARIKELVVSAPAAPESERTNEQKLADALRRRQEEVTRLSARLDRIREAIYGFYVALDRREDGYGAQSRAIAEIQQVLGMTWEQGATLKKGPVVKPHPVPSKENLDLVAGVGNLVNQNAVLAARVAALRTALERIANPGVSTVPHVVAIDALEEDTNNAAS